ncbi:uncharacterized protein YdeI (YjbR/CyaY-like superfamily) [Chitinophaga skermanii]|uniref:Uncharacterized protein YdeI (YjbR/CyaY-like superfamily) n=1 Tax=Chitinophaga skermanii TaxID=331697 RepID=A0A327QYG2_9BACT|nr:YdeI/OmpD-associated family protein [Chitinophaga skermanii]RAJ08662.1 uncharacterized protein YdeI (YjbR/CyaY-like superfamily) [Chitinophaga skermanii]
MAIQNPKVDWFFEKESKWQKEYSILRAIALDCGLTEELKWGCPTYTLNGQNVMLIHGFKDYCAILFMKGALLADENNILIQQTKNVQAARQIRFTSAKEIQQAESTIKAYIYEAIEVEKAGLQVEMKKVEAFEMAEEFEVALNKSAKLKKAFESLTPGRQRGYLLYFSSAKQAKTRQQRVDKYIPHILDGKGFEDE